MKGLVLNDFGAMLRDVSFSDENRRLVTRLIEAYEEFSAGNDSALVIRFEMGKAQNRIGVMYGSLGDSAADCLHPLPAGIVMAA
jgi:hypothetical protein